MSRVAIVFTGGTISMQPDPEAGGNRPALDGAAILALAPELDGLADLEPIDWGLVPASHLHFAQLLELAQIVDAQLARPDIDGAVVVQGTDTIEEAAFAYDLLLRSDKPVAVTGAMRTSSAPDFDGSRNLVDAVRHATNREMSARAWWSEVGGHPGGRCHEVAHDGTGCLPGTRPRPTFRAPGAAPADANGCGGGRSSRERCDRHGRHAASACFVRSGRGAWSWQPRAAATRPPSCSTRHAP